MSRIVWDKTGERWYEMGTDRGVVYPQSSTGTYPKGVAWNGLTAVTESPEGAEATDLWADNIKYGTLRSAETYGFTIEAYQSPEEFDACDGSAAPAPGVLIGQQTRVPFGFCYRTLLGNDTASESDDGYKLHLIYGATASPSERAYTTVNDSPEAATLSWECDTTPVNVTGFKPTASIVIDSTKVDPGKLKTLEDMLYGTEPTLLASQPDNWTTNYADYMELVDGEFQPVSASSGSAPTWTENKYYTAGTEASLPLPDEVIAIFTADQTALNTASVTSKASMPVTTIDEDDEI